MLIERVKHWYFDNNKLSMYFFMTLFFVSSYFEQYYYTEVQCFVMPGYQPFYI